MTRLFLRMLTDKHIAKLRRFPVEPLLAAGMILGIACVSRSWWIAVPAAGFLLFSKRNMAAALLFFALGCLSAWWQLPRETPPDVYGTAKILVTDMRLSQVDGLKSPSLIAAEILEFAPLGEPQKPHREKTFFRLPLNSSVLPVPGAVYQAVGLLAAPTADGFANYLYARKVKRTFQLDQIESLPSPKTWRNSLAALRDFLLKRTLNGISDPRIRQQAAGLFFNAGSGLSRESREQYLRSGTIHIFSVSGMHVAMLAALLFALLRFLPDKWREGAVLVILTLYVLSCGANSPALRALGMIGGFLILRMFLLQMPPIRLLSLLAAVLLLISPGLLFDIGFLYSFIITASLLLAALRLRDAKQLIRSGSILTNATTDRLRIERHTRPATWLLSVSGIALIPFFSGMAISICSRGLFLPGSVIANILLLPLVPFLFIFSGFKLLTGWIAVLDKFGAVLLNIGFHLLNAITGAVSSLLAALPVSRPSITEAILFYAALLLFLANHRWRVRLTAMGAALFMVVIWAVRPAFEPPFIAVFSADAGTPPMVVEAEPSQNRAVVYDAPTPEMSYAAADMLISKGINRIEVLRFSQARQDHCRGANALSSQLPIGHLEFPAQNSKRFSRTLLKNFPSEKLKYGSTANNPVKAIPEDQGWRLIINGKEYNRPYSRQIQLTLQKR